MILPSEGKLQEGTCDNSISQWIHIVMKPKDTSSKCTLSASSCE